MSGLGPMIINGLKFKLLVFATNQSGSLRDPSSQSSSSSGSSDRDSSPLRSNSPAVPFSAAAATPSHTPVPSGGKRTRMTFADIVRLVPVDAAERDRTMPDFRADTLPATESYLAGWSHPHLHPCLTARTCAQETQIKGGTRLTLNVQHYPHETSLTPLLL